MLTEHTKNTNLNLICLQSTLNQIFQYLYSENKKISHGFSQNFSGKLRLFLEVLSVFFDIFQSQNYIRGLYSQKTKKFAKGDVFFTLEGQQ